MKVLFVIDEDNMIDQKVSFIEEVFGNVEFKFFVQTALLKRFQLNTLVAPNIYSSYISNVEFLFDEYFKEVEADDCLIIYSSAVFTTTMMYELKDRIFGKFDVIYFSNGKKNINGIYKKFVKIALGTEDCGYSKKLQYLSKDAVEFLKGIGFKNRILNLTSNSSYIMCLDYCIPSLYPKMKPKKKRRILTSSMLVFFVAISVIFFAIFGVNVLNVIFLILTVISTVSAEILFTLKDFLDERLK